MRWRSIIVRGRIVVAAGAVALVAAFGLGPTHVNADCAVGSFCIQLDADGGTAGETIGATVSAPCDDPSTARITFVGADPGGYALLEPVPAGADAAFRFVVPDVAPGRYRIFFECTGFEAFEIAGGFEVRLGAPDTATLTRSGAADNPAPIFLALAAVVGAWVGTRRMGGDRSMSRR